MEEITLIFSTQLFANSPAIKKHRQIVLLEDRAFFTKFKFHKNKLLLHRASMKYYEDFLRKKGYKVSYIDFYQDYNLQNKTIHLCKVYDKNIENHLESLKASSKIIWYDSPAFISSEEEFQEFFKEKIYYSQTSFYINQRKKLNILLDKNGKPQGGKWSFDKENRAKFNFEIEIPKLKTYDENEYIKDAKNYIQKYFPNNYGKTDHFIFPITHQEVKLHLENFLKHRFQFFGKFEDAVIEGEPLLFHSNISYALNIGIITPQEIINTVINYAKENSTPLNSLEGFIRQIIGWREFMKNMYCISGEEMKSSNFFSHTNKLPYSFYNAQTGIYPIDEIISRTLKYSYNHHIERLMFLGNFLFLCSIHPNEVYKWFMEMYIDAYEWVMIPNVYGMSQYADGGSMITKPYLSSSNYILKMSNYKKGEWNDIFDGLYWRFFDKNKSFFKQNPRLRILYSYLQNISNEKLQKHIQTADNFLDKFL